MDFFTVVVVVIFLIIYIALCVLWFWNVLLNKQPIKKTKTIFKKKSKTKKQSKKR